MGFRPRNLRPWGVIGGIVAGLTVMGTGCAKSVSGPFSPGASASAVRNSCQDVHEAPLQGAPGQSQIDCGGGVSYQIQDGNAVAVYSKPAPGQATLQYWRQLWKGDAPRYLPIEGSKDVHGRMLYQLVSAPKRMAVIYDPSADQVIRVVNYGHP